MFGKNCIRKMALRVAVLAAVVAVMSVMPAMADTEEKDYTIGDAWWEINESRGAVAAWDQAESKTQYKVRLYRGDKSIGDWKSVSGTNHSFTKEIVSHGTGNYYFVVYAVKGGKESTLVMSDRLNVNNTDSSDVTMTFLKKISDGSSSAAVPQSTESISGVGPGIGPGGNSWQAQSDGTWKYLVNGQYAVNCWQQIDGRWYHFDGNGTMQTGWVWITGSDGVTRCYYLEPASNSIMPQGACYINTVTPDGCSVDGTGAWTVNGVVQTR